MATIRMRKGSVYADICDDPVCIENAKNEGYTVVVEAEKVVKQKEEITEEVVSKKATPKKSVK